MQTTQSQKEQALSLRSNIPLCIGLAVAFVIVVFASYFNPYYVNADTKRKASLYDQLCTAMRTDHRAFARYDQFCSTTGEVRHPDRRAFNVGEITEHERAYAKFWLNAYL